MTRYRHRTPCFSGLADMPIGQPCRTSVNRTGQRFGRYVVCAPSRYRDTGARRCWICRDMTTGQYEVLSVAAMKRAEREAA